MEMRAKAPVANVVSIGGAITEGVINGINEVCEFRKYSPPHGGGVAAPGKKMSRSNRSGADGVVAQHAGFGMYSR
jgi:hypothetical protein